MSARMLAGVTLAGITTIALAERTSIVRYLRIRRM